jgi:hypothetical protein
MIQVSMNQILVTATLASLVINWLTNQPPTVFNILSVFCFGFFPDDRVLVELDYTVEQKLPQPEPQDTPEVSDEELEAQEATEETTQEAAQEASQEEELEEGEIREEMVVDEESTSLSSYNEALLHEVVREIIREQTTATDDVPTQNTSDAIPTTVSSSEVPVQ